MDESRLNPLQLEILERLEDLQFDCYKILRLALEDDHLMAAANLSQPDFWDAVTVNFQGTIECLEISGLGFTQYLEAKLQLLE